MPLSTRVKALVTFAGAVVVICGAAGPAVADNGVPFKDPGSIGSLGFCDKSNQPVTSGSIFDKPFVWKAVSDTPAPATHASKRGKATLYAFSPIENVAPGDWSPYQMTGSSTYTNKTYPMTAGTYGDPPLEYQVTAFPPVWDHLVQIRLTLTDLGQQALITKYPTAVIKVSGTTWTMVQGDRSPQCAKGTALSSELVTLPKNLRPTASPTPTGSAAPGSNVSSSPSPSSSDVSDPNSTDEAQAASDTANVAGPPVWLIGLALVGATLLGAAGFAFFSSRRSS
jgi:hypothetical protein